MSDHYTSRTLEAVIDGLDRPQSFLLDRFFPEMAMFDTERIDFDLLDRAQGIAPFVSPNVEGKPIKSRGYTTRSFVPAYLKPKDAIDTNKPLRKRAGERIGGQLSPAERHDAMIADTLEVQRNSIVRRKEWMAAQALAAGAVVVSGEDYPEQTVDFQRYASLTEILTGGDRWGESGVIPKDGLEAKAEAIATLSGAVVTDIIVEPAVWSIMRRDEIFLSALDNRRAMDGSIAQLGPQSGGEGNWGRYVGSHGQFDIWVYQQPYTDDAGNAAKMMPDYGVMLVSPQIEGYQAHGAIRDPKAGYQPTEIWPKQWIAEDPPVEWVMSQSAPLVIPARPNASAFIRVR